MPCVHIPDIPDCNKVYVARPSNATLVSSSTVTVSLPGTNTVIPSARAAIVTEVVISPTPTASELPSERLDRAILEQLHRELGVGSPGLSKRSLPEMGDPHRLPGESNSDMEARRTKERLQKYGLVDGSGNWRKKQFFEEVKQRAWDKADKTLGKGKFGGAQQEDEGPEAGERLDPARERETLVENGMPEDFARYLFPDEGEEVALPDPEEALKKAEKQQEAAERLAEIEGEVLEEELEEGRREILLENGVPPDLVDAFFKADAAPAGKPRGKQERKRKHQRRARIFSYFTVDPILRVFTKELEAKSQEMIKNNDTRIQEIVGQETGVPELKE